MNTRRPDLESLLEIAVEIGGEAAELIARMRHEGVSIAATKSSSVDVVTAADRAAEDLIRTRLTERRPDDGFYGEESGASESASGLTWIVDPIDGTVNYLYGIPEYAVSIAVAEGPVGEEPSAFTALAGAVIAPALGETYTAVLGGGAFCNGDELRLPDAGPESLAQALVATGFSYRAERRVLQAEVLLGLIGRVRDVRRRGAASLDLCAVAAGQVDAYYEFGLSPWDHAAGSLIAREAGARVSGLGLEEREGRGSLLAGHETITSSLTDLLRLTAPKGLFESKA